MVQIIYNTKQEGINVLSNYFRKINTTELNYYLDYSNYESIPVFFDLNIYEPEDINLKNLLQIHLMIVLSKIFELRNELNNIMNPIKISFKSDLIYWDNLFVIDNNIFISFKYLKKVFDSIQYNKYQNMSEVYMENNKIYDLGLIKSLSNCIYSILTNLNENEWDDFISQKYNCLFIPKSVIKFSNSYIFLQNPNINYTKDKIAIYYLDSYNIYASFYSISSVTKSFSPYWEQKIIKLNYISKNNSYEEVEVLDLNKYKMKSKSFINNLCPNPFEDKIIKLTNTLFY